MNFKKIKQIKVNAKSQLKNNIFITFDTDWCSDEVLNYSLDLLNNYKVNSTFFITNKTRLLETMRKNSKIELGIHPNFNPLLSGDFKYGKNINEVITYFKKIVPEAVSARSHSMTQNAHILDSFEKNGIKFDCNTFIPISANINLKPYKHWSRKIIKVPYFWEDHIHCIYGWKYDIKKFLILDSIKVFNFHPIHIFLNTERIDRYKKSKRWIYNWKNLKKFRNSRYGTESFLIDLLNTKDK